MPYCNLCNKTTTDDLIAHIKFVHANNFILESNLEASYKSLPYIIDVNSLYPDQAYLEKITMEPEIDFETELSPNAIAFVNASIEDRAKMVDNMTGKDMRHMTTMIDNEFRRIDKIKHPMADAKASIVNVIRQR